MRAANGARTRDPQLGKLMLYQLSYCRLSPRGECDSKGSIFFSFCNKQYIFIYPCCG